MTHDHVPMMDRFLDWALGGSVLGLVAFLFGMTSLVVVLSLSILFLVGATISVVCQCW